jgi:hypothetical protein
MLTHDCYGCKASYPCDDLCKDNSHPAFSLCDSCLDDMIENYRIGTREKERDAVNRIKVALRF